MKVKFENKYFGKFNFSEEQIRKYLKSAYKDLRIARESKVEEVRFQFSYNALLKLGISLIACFGYKVRSRAGHHVKILEKSAEILNSRNVLVYGNQMRKARNTELYGGGSGMITQKQADEYIAFVEKTFHLSRDIFKKHLHTLF